MATRLRDKVNVEFLLFLCTGALATVIDVAIFHLLTSLTGLNRTLCFIAAFYTAAVCRFWGDRNVTFRTDKRAAANGSVAGQLFRYLLVCSGTMAVGIAVYHLARWGGCSNLAGKLVSIPVVTVSGFLFFKLVVFTQRRRMDS